MPDKKQTFSREELDYTNDNNDFDRKCAKCDHRSRQDDTCEMMPETDNEVSDGGTCKKFTPGKHVIIDLDLLEAEQRKRRMWNYNRRRNRILQNLRKN